MFTNDQIKKIIKKSDLIPAKEFDKITADADKANLSIERYLAEKNLIAEEALFEAASTFFKVDFIKLKDQKINKEILLSIPETMAYAHNLVAFEANDKEIKIATSDPKNIEVLEFIRKKFNLEPIVYLATPGDIKNCLKLYEKTTKKGLDYLMEGNNDVTEISTDHKNLEQLASDLPVVKIVNNILEYAINEDASDIHIEPEEDNVLVRYRVDGILNDGFVLPKNLQSGLIARIKILANLKIDEHRLPQDGRFKTISNGTNISFRVSIIPTFDGEKIVIRLLYENAQALSLEELGLQLADLETVKRNIKKPQGMILVTGPTGCGKTTTLYTILNILNTPRVNISTIEDPIEYRTQRVNQSQVNQKIGYTFAQGLRALLRQDPDIIMVGEIRDEETAEISVHAAMTGHLLLSSLHTNDAVNAIPRLGNLNIPSFLIATTTNVIIAQRLVRKICKNCIQSYHMDEEVITEIQKQFNIKKIMGSMEKEKIINNGSDTLKSMLFFRGKGCPECNNTGYKGRIGIYEILEVTPEISELITKKATASEIKKLAEAQGMTPMVNDGFIKAKNGITTIEEIMRAIKE